MGAIYSEDGKLLGGCWPTWDAHHFAIEHRANHTDESWAKLIENPDWTEHARDDMRAERICDGCLKTVASGGGTGGPAARARAQAELATRLAEYAKPKEAA
jgi:hypothetical protein